MRALVLVAALALAAPAVAQAPAANRLTLADTASAPTRPVIVDGASWRCEPTGVCSSSGGANQPAARACRRAVARLGQVTEFVWKGEALSAEDLAVCNG
ncbi:MAG: CC_3452 family protein [Brevundimonas sp.]|uniref:CC_3452 family protein n=1 Tax=Brevundimonas sp. TaxID=1871086 RepID=UPI003919D6F3